MPPNTLYNNQLSHIRLFLKESGYKQLRYRPSLFPPKVEKMLGRIEIVSDGRDVWWEQRNKRGDKRLDERQYPKIYALTGRYLDEFFKNFAKKLIKESKKREKC